MMRPVELVSLRPFGSKTGASEVDRYATNPLLDHVHAVTHGALKGAAEAPTMWNSGNLPPFCASGLDPAFLQLVPYECRHAAAMNPDPGQVLAMAENGGDDPERFQTPESAAALEAYRQRVWNWATKQAPLS